MKSMKSVYLAVLGLCIASGAHAASVGSTIDISTTVVAACSVSTSPVDFGDYDTVTPLYANGSIDVTCTDGAPYNIALDGGANFDAPTNSRYLSDGGANSMQYAVYANAALTTTWGDTDFANTNPWPSLSDTGNGAVQPHTVYGELYHGQDVPLGSYSDVLTVTVYY